MVEMGRFKQVEDLEARGWKTDDITSALQHESRHLIGGSTFLRCPDGDYYSCSGGMERKLTPQPDADFTEAARVRAIAITGIAIKLWNTYESRHGNFKDSQYTAGGRSTHVMAEIVYGIAHDSADDLF